MNGIISLTNELLFYGFISMHNMPMVEDCRNKNLFLNYISETYVLSRDFEHNVDFKPKAKVDFDKKLILNGGYAN